MIGYCQQNGSPEPEFLEYSSGFSVVFRFKEAMHTGQKAGIAKPTLNIRQEKILEVLATEKIMSANQICTQLDNNPSLRTVQADLTILKAAGLIEQIGKGRTSLWKIKI